jgi:hypothetical protein
MSATVGAYAGRTARIEPFVASETPYDAIFARG